MLKKIPLAALAPGMYLEKIEGSYLQHPFWRRSFLLRTADEIHRLVSSGIAEVWIDIARGADVPLPADPSVPGVPTAPTPPVPEPRRAALPAGGSAQQRAMVLRHQAKSVVTELFTDARMGRALDTEGCLPLVDQISGSLAEDPGAFIGLVRLRHQDEYTYLHSVAVCALMIGLARALGQDEEAVRRAGLAGLLHDLGKALMPLEVLNKPGKLTDEEFAVIRGHPLRGWEMLKAGERFDEAVADVCLHHHEKFDGSGYPDGQAGEGISLLARMGAVCDVYDAVTSNRPYKTAWDPGESLRRMAQWKGHFDPHVFQAFIKTVGIYPLGALVRLQSQRLAVVTEQRPQALLTPKVKAFFSVRANLHVTPQELDLAAPGCRDRIVGVEAPETWGFQGLERLWLEVPLAE